MGVYGGDAPDPGPAAAATEYAVDASKEASAAQLAESTRQFDLMMPFMQELSSSQSKISGSQVATAEAQTRLMEEASAQGRDYFDYQKSFRPVEQEMMREAMVDRSGDVAAFDAANQRDATAMTADDSTVYNANRGSVDADVGRAVADTQGAYTRNLNQAMRQGLRYGGSGANVASQVGTLGMAQASQTAAAANGTRNASIGGVRQRLAAGLQLRQSNMAAKNSQEAIGWAKKLDAAGIVKNLPGASQGAYGLAVGAGNAATNAYSGAIGAGNASGANLAMPGQNYLAGLQGASNTKMQGANMGIQGNLGIMNASQSEDQTGSIVGSVAGIGMAVL